MQKSSSVDVFCDAAEHLLEAEKTAKSLGIHLNTTSGAEYQLRYSAAGVFLQSMDAKKHGMVMVEFASGSAAYRRFYGGGNGQMIAKAVGVSGKFKPKIFDATAGLGGDAFVLASLGCQLLLMERSPIAYALLQDGISRAVLTAAQNDKELLEIVSRMRLMEGNSIDYLNACDTYVADVIYLDPMFPERNKTAAVKKEMQAFHVLMGQDMDDQALLLAALPKAKYRVVVKRPRLAPSINGSRVSYQLEGKSSRYDIYVNKSISQCAS
jgi:16S rRNA (guanine1516-N2)-methyltransferase